MQKNWLLLAVMLGLTFMKPADAQNHHFLRMMTYDIYAPEERDAEKFSWFARKPKVISIIKYHSPDVFGLQNANTQQLKDISEQMADYSATTFYNDYENGYQAVFFKNARFNSLDQGAFWLSVTPEKPWSKSWKAETPGNVAWVKLKDKNTGHAFFVFCARFDKKSPEAKTESAQLLLKKIAEITGKSISFLFVNINAMEVDPVYQEITYKNNSLKDSKYYTMIKHHGPSYSYIGYPPAFMPERTYDFIFFKDPLDELKILIHATIADHWDGFYPSKHLPVVIHLRFNEYEK